MKPFISSGSFPFHWLMMCVIVSCILFSSSLFVLSCDALATRVLFCPSASKGHYNPFMNVVKHLVQYNQDHGHTYDIHVSTALIEKFGMMTEWIKQDFAQYEYQVIDQPSNQVKQENKTLFFYKYGEWKGDVLKMNPLELLDVFASFSIQSFNFFMERYLNYPEERPDIIVIDSMDFYYSYFDMFQQLNVKFNNSVKFVTLATTLSEALDMDQLPITHPNSISELIWGTIVDQVIGKLGFLHNHYQWFQMRVWKYSIIPISVNMFTTHIFMPFLRILFHCYAIVKIRPHYRTDLMVQPLSNLKMYIQVSDQFPVMTMTPPGVLESVRMKAYPKYFDIGFPIILQNVSRATSSTPLEKWMDDIAIRNERMIFISTGSQFKLSLETNRNILQGLSLLLKSNEDLHVLMRVDSTQQQVLENELSSSSKLQVGSGNSSWKSRVLLSSEFLPQQFILNHNSTKLFVTHCGFNSVSEGIYYGNLLVGIPITADQFLVCNRIQENNFGDWIYSNWITPQLFSELLQSVLDNRKKQERIKWASALFHHYSSKSGESIHQALDFTMRFFNNRDSNTNQEFDELSLPYEYSFIILLTNGLQCCLVIWLLRKTCSLSLCLCCCPCCCPLKSKYKQKTE